MSFNSKYTGAQVEELLGKIPTANNIWHEGNFTPSNYLPLSGGKMNASAYISWGNSIEGEEDYSAYGLGIKLLGYNASNNTYRGGIHVGTRYGWQLVRDGVTGGFYVRYNNVNTNAWGEWKTIAFTDSNVASATKLQTARTIWGQNFDGSGNIDGNMLLKGQYVEIILQGTNSYNTGISFNDYEGNPRWYFSYRGLNAADKDFYIYRYTDDNSYHVAMSLIRSNGNVGIGTTNPTTKLDVTGSIHSSGGITQDSDINLKNKIKDVLLSINEIAEAPLFEFTYKSDENKRIHVGTSAQYWVEKNNWFCKKQNNGYYDMEIQNLALASAISIAKEFKKYKEETESTISSMKKEIEELKQIVLNMNK